MSATTINFVDADITSLRVCDIVFTSFFPFQYKNHQELDIPKRNDDKNTQELIHSHISLEANVADSVLTEKCVCERLCM